MNILFPVAECVPYAKTGGLADVAGALPDALAKREHAVAVVLPWYQSVRLGKFAVENTSIRFVISAGAASYPITIKKAKTRAQKAAIYFIVCDALYDRPGLYGNGQGDYPDNDIRFIVFSKAVLELGQALQKSWDIIHCQDWHTGLIPAYVKHLYAGAKAYSKTRTLMTIHNLAYQGCFPAETMLKTGLPSALFTMEGMEFYGMVNFFKTGLVYADWISTVSPTYAKEITTAAAGAKLEGVLRNRKSRLSGILNGLDYKIWNPKTDPHLAEAYSKSNLAGKAAAKAALLKAQKLRAGAKRPLLGIISRLDDQKGFDLLAEALGRIMSLDLNLVLLGTGAPAYHEFFNQVKAKYPKQIGINLTFNNALAHQIYAGSDIFLMPSLYEPCGLGQMIAMRYGTIPLVRKTGGLADTVIDQTDAQGNGFVFEPYASQTLYETVVRAIRLYADAAAWTKLVKRAMQADFSWETAAENYEALYKKIKKA